MMSGPAVQDRRMGDTEMSRAKAGVLIVVLLLTICAVPSVQPLRTARTGSTERENFSVHGSEANVVETVTAQAMSRPLRQTWFRRLTLANRRALRAMHAFEDRLEEESWFRKAMEYPMQYVETCWLRHGNEQVTCGHDGWLFYRPDVSLLTGPAFLDPRQLARRAAGGEEWERVAQPDPLEAILHFGKQLEGRGIALVVMPTPTKPMIYPEKLFRGYGHRGSLLRNASTDGLYRRLRKRGVLVFDPAESLFAEAGSGTGSSLYLRTDTHWAPDAMTRTARELAAFLLKHVDLPPVPAPGYRLGTERVDQHGDLVVMLSLTNASRHYPRESVTIQQVLNGRGEMWKRDSSADVLVLGDSFSNVYSHDAMGWGFSAGFIEHLSYHLQRPVDRLVRNDDGAFATRAMLRHDLACGRDRLKAKRVVVWQFAARELAAGDWRLLDMDVRHAPERSFLTPRAGSEVLVTGTVESVSSVPKPGRVPYKDYIMALHVRDLRHGDRQLGKDHALIYTWGMRHNEWTPMAYVRPGQIVRMRVKSWYDMGEEYERINRGELDGEDILLAPPCWGVP